MYVYIYNYCIYIYTCICTCICIYIYIYILLPLSQNYMYVCQIVPQTGPIFLFKGICVRLAPYTSTCWNGILLQQSVP